MTMDDTIKPLIGRTIKMTVSRFTKFAVFFGRGRRIRTLIYGFGDRCSTIELYPYKITYLLY